MEALQGVEMGSSSSSPVQRRKPVITGLQTSSLSSPRHATPIGPQHHGRDHPALLDDNVAAAAPISPPVVLALEDDNDDHHRDLPKLSGSWLRLYWHELTGRWPWWWRIREQYRGIPPRYRYYCFWLWIAWKVTSFLIVVYFLGGSSYHGIDLHGLGMEQSQQSHVRPPIPIRILYVVTSLADHNNGRRGTVRNQDRWHEVTMPLLVDNVATMMVQGYTVDLYLILAWTMDNVRRQRLLASLPAHVGLQVWNDAMPWSKYYVKTTYDKLRRHEHALARQHRYVVKDKLAHYDVFAVFEDDMRVTGPHVAHYLHVSDQLQRLYAVQSRAANNNTVTIPAETRAQQHNPYTCSFDGALSPQQLRRLLPGFLRVEVILNATVVAHPDGVTQAILDPIPLPDDLAVLTSADVATPCCHVLPPSPLSSWLPNTPSSDRIVLWETSIRALSVRQLPSYDGDLGWVALLPGPDLPGPDLVPGFWSGRTGAYGTNATKPHWLTPGMAGQQGGWLLTRSQLWQLHTQLCTADFLPPLLHERDGLLYHNTEYWSGGFQIFSPVLGGCNMQRIMTVNDAAAVSRHFLYHVSNIKQSQKPRERLVRALHLLGQLHTVQQWAMAEQAARRTAGAIAMQKKRSS